MNSTNQGSCRSRVSVSRILRRLNPSRRVVFLLLAMAFAFSLRVEPPAKVARPTSQAANIGDTVLFNLTATGTDPLYYQWLLNGDAIQDQTSASLALQGVTLADAGFYSV